METALGASAALLSAFCYACSSLLFRRLGDQLSPMALNLAKGVFAVLFTAAFVAATGFQQVPLWAVGLLALSGFLGITLGDTAYFAGLTQLGPRRALVLDTMSPGFTAMLSVLILGEHLSLAAIAGVVATSLGVGWVLSERVSGVAGGLGDLRRGVMWGLASMMFHSLGVICSKTALEVVPSLEASLVRQSVAALLVGVGMAGSPGGFRQLASLKEGRTLRLMIAAAFTGSFLGIWFQLIALKAADASVASALNATAPLFVLPLSRIFDGEKISLRAAAGACLAVVGVVLLLQQR